MSGDVGSSRRVEYAPVGDTTNTAARSAMDTPHQLLVADETRHRLRASDGLAPTGEVDVCGRAARHGPGGRPGEADQP